MFYIINLKSSKCFFQIILLGNYPMIYPNTHPAMYPAMYPVGAQQQQQQQQQPLYYGPEQR